MRAPWEYSPPLCRCCLWCHCGVMLITYLKGTHNHHHGNVHRRFFSWQPPESAIMLDSVWLPKHWSQVLIKTIVACWKNYLHYKLFSRLTLDSKENKYYVYVFSTVQKWPQKYCEFSLIHIYLLRDHVQY